jgi:hypothetical protein
VSAHQRLCSAPHRPVRIARIELTDLQTRPRFAANVKSSRDAFFVLGIVLFVQGCATPSPRTPLLQSWTTIGTAPADWQRTESTVTGLTTAGDSLLVSDKVYGDVTFSATASTPNREASLAVRMKDAANGYLLIFVPDGLSWNNGVGGIWFAKRTAGAESRLGYYHGAGFPSLRQNARLAVVAAGASFKITLNGSEILSVTDATFPSGRVGLRIYGDSGLPCSATFGDVQVSETGTTSDARARK